MRTRNIRLALAASLRIAIVLLALPINAQAGFIDDYGTWNQLSIERKRAYIMGMFDISANTASDKTSEAMANGLRQCANKTQLNAQMLIETIDDYYRNHKDKWSENVAYVFMETVISNVCRSYIDAERKKVGLQPLP